MKKKFLSILFALVLVCSFSLVTAVPVAAAVGESTFTVTDGIYTTTPTGGEPYTTGDIGASLTGTWSPNDVIGDFTASGTGSMYATGHHEESGYGTTVTVEASGTMSADEITFSGTAVRTLDDNITEDAFDSITGTVVITDGVIDVVLVGWDEAHTYTVDILMSGSVVGPVINEDSTESFFTIQAAIDDADTLAGHTVNVATGDYAGAIVNKGVKIIGEADGTSIITSGVIYKADGPSYYTGFRLDADADGAEIRNFTMNGEFWFGVFARNADSVIVDSLALNDMVQGITSWGGSNWEITNNVITETYPTSGGSIAIYLGADPGDFPHCDNNLVRGNTLSTAAVQNPDFTGAAICLWFDMRGITEMPTGVSVTGNEIIGNSITASGLENQTGIEIGVGGLEGDIIKVAACLGVIHDNTVTNNTIDNAEWGLYLYVTTDLTVSGNTIKNCSDCGIYMKDDHANCLINYNDIYGNTNYGLNNTDGAAYERTVDATKNWWGDVAGPDTSPKTTGLHNPYELWTEGDAVSDGVDYLPWLIQIELVEGWNIWSDPVTVDVACLPKLDDTEQTVELAYYFDSTTQDWWNIPADASPMDAWYIKMLEPVTVNTWASSEATFLWQKEMKVGWNFVGLAELYKMEASEALLDAYWGTGVATDLTGYTKVISPSLNGESWTFLRPAIMKGPSPFMLPTKGYWVFMVNDGVLGGFSSTPIVEVEEPLPGPQW